MNSANQKSPSYADEMKDFKRIFHKIMQSKNIIIFTSLFFVLSALSYSLQQDTIYESSVLVEVGNSKSIENNLKIVKDSTSLIESFKTGLLKGKFKINGSIKLLPIEESLLRLSSKSNSIQENSLVINQAISVIKNLNVESFEKLNNNNIIYLNNAIIDLEDELLFNKQIYEINKNKNKQLIEDNYILERNEIENLLIKMKEELKSVKTEMNSIRVFNENFIFNEIKKINRAIPEIKKQIELIDKVIKADQSNLELLASNPQLYIERAAKEPTLSQIIFQYKTQLLNFQTKIKQLENKAIVLESNPQLILEESQKNSLISIIHLLNKRSQMETEITLLKKNLEFLESNKIMRLEQLNLEKWQQDYVASVGIFSLKKEQNVIKKELNFLMNPQYNSARIVGEIKTTTHNVDYKFFIFLGLILGFVSSLFFILIKEFVNAFKRSSP